MNLKITEKNLKKLEELSKNKQISVQKLINQAVIEFLIIEKETQEAVKYAF